MLDILSRADFQVASLSTAIDKLPYKPTWLGSQGLFKKKGVTNPAILIEEREGTLSLVPTQARGTMPTAERTRKRKMRTFQAHYLPQNMMITASQVAGVRAFGEEEQVEVFSEIVAEGQQQLKDNIETTIEYHRVGAVQGLVLDADGTTVLNNLFTDFGITEQSVDFDFTTDDIKLLAQTVIRNTRNALGGSVYTGIQALCGDAFWDDLISCDSVKEAFDRWQNGQFFREQQIESGFPYAGIDWFNYRGKIGDLDFVDTDTARFYPKGTTDVFIEHYAPADFIETVNTVGKPFYSKQRVVDFDMGVELHAQSNPLLMCTRPRCLVKGNRTTSGGSS